jgi:hypothetical protein
MIDDLVSQLSAADMQQLLEHLAAGNLKVSRANIKRWMRNNFYEGRDVPLEDVELGCNDYRDDRAIEPFGHY